MVDIRRFGAAINAVQTIIAEHGNAPGHGSADQSDKSALNNIGYPDGQLVAPMYFMIQSLTRAKQATPIGNNEERNQTKDTNAAKVA